MKGLTQSLETLQPIYSRSNFMPTEKQIAANQLNALKSTGPRTEEGKQASSQNALTHGLTARKSVILGDENEAEFNDLRQSLRDHYLPTGPIEKLFVDTLAAHFWRLQRVPKFETLLLQVSQATAVWGVPGNADDQGPQGPSEHLDPVVAQLLAIQQFMVPKDVFGKISRYEAHLLREIHKTLQVLGPPPVKRGVLGTTAATMSSQSKPTATQRDDTHERILRSNGVHR